MDKPPIVTAEEWDRARAELLLAEKELTRAQDALAARRRRLPMVRFANDYVFAGQAGQRTLLDLFDGHETLVIYQFMDVGPDQFCGGCTMFTDNVPEHGLVSLEGKGISWATVSDMPLAQLSGYAEQKGWTMPVLSSRGTTFSADCGTGPGFLLSVFLRDGDDVYRTYTTTSRGVDRLVFAHSILDLAPYGRQEEWEDSPAGWPQHPTYA